MKVPQEARLPAPTIIKLQKVRDRTALSRSAIYAKISTGEFPAQISLGKRSIGFVESEVDRWILDRIEASRKGACV